ncbi:MAG: hypothetical protein Q4G71_11655 [Pseudomonadota bacterium]|nr:hypothetical protein [Pseudomonadota bacterium]
MYGSFGGFWASSSTAVSATRPNDSNLLLGFTTGGSTYSTGVDDATLTANGVVFSPQVFLSLPVSGIASASNIGIVRNWGGTVQQATGDVPSNPGRPIAYYLDDGTQGLELGTALFNIRGQGVDAATSPYGRIEIALNGAAIDPAHVTDAVPDLIVTQMGDPGRADVFELYDSNGDRVGNAVPINFSSASDAPTVGRQLWTLYGGNPASPGTGGREEDRAVRMAAFRLSDFLDTPADAARVVGLRQILSGASDPAFIAYNAASVPVVLPELTLTKTATPSPMAVGGTGTYTLTLANASTQAATSGSITVTDTLPTGVVPTAAAGTGWTCSIAGQAVACTRTLSVAASASAPAITIDVSVDATAAATVTNSATASGGGDTACPAAARCTGSATTPVTGGIPLPSNPAVAAIPTLGLPGLLLMGLGVGLLGLWRRRT